jgi:glycosyltransferase involved in cell wall biosynthesis
MRQKPVEEERMARIRALEQFGVGQFDAESLAKKCALVRQRMGERHVPHVPAISVIIPAYREQGYILATLRSLAEQRLQNCEFIIVSNGEPRGNPTQRLAAQCGFCVIHDPRRGIARARQTGLAAARGQIIVTTDADTVHHAAWLSEIQRIMNAPEIFCGAGLVRSLSERSSVRAAQRFIGWTMIAKHSIHPRLVTGVSEANSFYRRGPALKAGGYDTGIRVGEGMALFRKIHDGAAPLIFTDPNLVVFSSGRRIEQHGITRWLGTATWNTTLQAFGHKGVDNTRYPDLR